VNIHSTLATEEQQAGFFASVGEGFAEGIARVEPITHHVRLAGTTIRLRFAGPALVRIVMPALHHAIADPVDAPDLDVCLWDSASTGVPLALPRGHLDFSGRGNIWGFESARYKSAFQWGEESISVMDLDTNQAYYWVATGEHLPPWVMASPIRGILHWWMEKNGLQLIHAAVVGHNGCGALIPGRGGSGKSSTAVACLAHGMQFVGDDYVALALDPEPRAYCLYGTAKLDPHSLDAFPDLARSCRTETGPGFDKIILFPEGSYRERFAPSLRLTCILKPVVTGRPETTLGPASEIDVERALAAETLAHLPHAGPHTLGTIERTLWALPRASILLGTDRRLVAEAVRSVLASPPARSEPRPAHETKPERTSMVSVLVRLHDADPAPLRALVSELEAQDYARVEILILADGGAVGLADEAAKAPFNVYFLTFDNDASKAHAWNRGVRDSFGELIVFLEPDDHLPAGALQAMAEAAAAVPAASLIRGLVEGDAGGMTGAVLAGTMIRKDAFRACGLFDTDPIFFGREERDWVARFKRQGLTEQMLQRPTLYAGRNASDAHAVRHGRMGLRAMKERLDFLHRSRG
jgi:Glycosyl transferase family 2